MRTKKKQIGGAAVYILGVYAIVLILLTGLYLYQVRSMNYIRDTYDTGLLLALLGAATLNVEEYGRTGQAVIHGTYLGEGNIFEDTDDTSKPDSFLEQTLKECQKLVASNLGLQENMESKHKLIIGPVVVEEFKVFNVYKKRLEDGEEPQDRKNRIQEFSYRNGSWSVITYAEGEKVFAGGAGEGGNGFVEVEDTTVYMELSFSVAVFPYFPGLSGENEENEKEVRVSLKRSISVPVNGTEGEKNHGEE